MQSCQWLNNLTAVDQPPFDFETIDFIGHPAFEKTPEQEKTSDDLTALLAREFRSTCTMIDEYIDRAARPGVLTSMRQRATRLFTKSKKAPSFGDFCQSSEFTTLRKSLGRVQNAVSERLLESESPVFSKQFNRLELEIFRLLFYSSLKASDLDLGIEPKLDTGQAQQAANLKRNGIINASLADTAKQRLKAVLAPYLESVQREPSDPREIGKYDRAVYFSAKEHGEIYQTLDELFLTEGIYALATSYTGLAMSLNSVVLHQARHGDEHIYQTFNDRKYTPKTINMHFDPKYGLIKLIIYINKPGQNDGPFTYIPGSNNFEIDTLFKAAAKANSVTNYLQTEDERSTFIKLPRQMRCNAIFGSMLTDASPESPHVLASEIKLTAADYGDLFVFDPNGMHRGGICEPGGERFALQVILRPTVRGKFVEGL
ncbi:MAG: hypothetical protein H6905_04175 [Hyphomicrobiales bacterium]|nr:hypothetical protein [Hyphomicrobiales bacterium]